MKSSRETAFDILLSMKRNKSYSNLLIDSTLKKSDFDKKDKAFVTALVYGVIEREITIKWILSNNLKNSINKLKPEVLIALEIGVYQLMFMDKVPSFAAINESIELVKKNKCAYASGLVNAVLRKISKESFSYPNSSIKYSCPSELINLFVDSYGEETSLKILENFQTKRDVYLKVNTLKTSSDELIEILLKEGIETEKFDYCDNALKVNNLNVSFDETTAYKNGLFHVQDLSCQIAITAFDVKDEETVFDMCSAPGGKCFSMAQMMNNTGKIYSFDLTETKVKLISDSLKRLSVTNTVAKVNDASVYDSSLPLADKILCDVPCSGFGLISRKPEVRYKDLNELKALPEIQYSILETSSEYLKPNGILMYSTCTLNKHENEEVCNKFLEVHNDFEKKEMKTIFPFDYNSDGFFYCIIGRKG